MFNSRKWGGIVASTSEHTNDSNLFENQKIRLWHWKSSLCKCLQITHRPRQTSQSWISICRRKFWTSIMSSETLWRRSSASYSIFAAFLITAIIAQDNETDISMVTTKREIEIGKHCNLFWWTISRVRKFKGGASDAAKWLSFSGMFGTELRWE